MRFKLFECVILLFFFVSFYIGLFIEFIIVFSIKDFNLFIFLLRIYNSF